MEIWAGNDNLVFKVAYRLEDGARRRLVNLVDQLHRRCHGVTVARLFSMLNQLHPSH